MISEEVTGLRSQLERARAEKENVEEALSEAQVMLAQEQREHRRAGGAQGKHRGTNGRGSWALVHLHASQMSTTIVVLFKRFTPQALGRGREGEL